MQSVKDSLSVTYEARPSSVAEARAALTEFAANAGATELRSTRFGWRRPRR